MDFNKLKKLNGFHVIFLTQNTMVGLGLLSMPYDLSAMGFSQWWLPLLYGVVANITLIPIFWLMMQYKNDNLYTIHEKLLGKWFGKVLNFFFSIYIVVIISAVIEGYLDLIRISALQDKTITGTLIVFMALLVYIVHGGIKSIARFCIMSFVLTIWMLYFLQWPLLESHPSQLLPIGNFKFEDFLTATKNGYASFIGYELIMFYFPYVIYQQKAFKYVSIGIWITTTIYFLVTIISVMYFSEWQLKNVIYPILMLYKEAELSFLERVDVLGITAWVFLVLSTSSAYLWVAKKGLDSVRSKNKIVHLYIIAAAAFIFILIPFSKEFQETLYQRIFYIKYALILWPNVLILMHFIRFRKKERIT